MGYAYLAIAIVCEVIATTSLKASDGFSLPIPSAIVVVGYSASFYFLALVLKTIPVGIAYSIWAGLGIVLVSILGSIVYRQIPDLPAMLGMGLIIGGVLVIHLFSNSIHTG